MERNSLPVKVLHMTMLGAGGISTLIVNIHKSLDLEKVQFDYLVFRNQKEFYEDDIIKLGGKKVVVDVSTTTNKVLLYMLKYKKTKKILKDNIYDVMHVDASTPLDFIIGLAAKHAGIKRIVIHSHNSGDTKKNFLKRGIMYICKTLMPVVFTDFFAASDEAAEFMFPKTIFDNKKYVVIKNGINARQYTFSEDIRTAIRLKLKIDEEFVIGHIGRFTPQKNHEFIINVFEKMKEKKDKIKLILIGIGELEEDIRRKAKDLKIDNNIIFYGLSNKIPAMLCAFDAFIFPSRWEGLGIAGIEAQCSGLRTYCSVNVPEEANITDLFIRISSEDPVVWAERILGDYDKAAERSDRILDVKKAGFDIENTAMQLQSFYLE